jgi:carboxymethylenebutenolidase
MSQDRKNQQQNDPQRADIARRDFVALSMGASLSAAAGAAAARELDVVETDVEIKTPDGTCDAAFIHPRNGSHAGVLIWPDAFGLRPSMRGIGRRIAAHGYSVLVPNPFYRVSKAPFTNASNFNFENPADMAKLRPLMASVNAAGSAEKDAIAYIGFLDSQKEVDKTKKIGTQGYCMGGALVVRTAAELPSRVGAGRRSMGAAS